MSYIYHIVPSARMPTTQPKSQNMTSALAKTSVYQKEPRINQAADQSTQVAQGEAGQDDQAATGTSTSDTPGDNEEEDEGFFSFENPVFIVILIILFCLCFVSVAALATL